MNETRAYEELRRHLDSLAEDLTGKPDKTAIEQKKAKAYNTAFWETMHTGIPSDALKEGGDGSGGYLVPDTYEDTLVEALRKENVLRRLGYTIQTTRDLNIAVAHDSGGAAWVKENEPIYPVDAAFDKLVLGAYKLATSVRISDELLEDSGFDLERYIRREFGERIGRAEEEAFLTSSGTGRPTGLIHQAPVGVVSEREGDVTLDDMISLMHSVKAGHRQKGVWLLSEDVDMRLRRIKLFDGRPIWERSLATREPDILFGHKAYTTKHLDEVAPGNTVALFGNFDYYWIGDRGKRVMKRLAEVLANHGQVKFIASERVDARLVLPEAVKSLKIKG